MQSSKDAMAAVAGGYSEPRLGDGADRSSPLFRPKALKRHTETQFGSPVALMPVSWTVLGLFLAVMVLAAAVFLSTASYARKESARGILRPVAGEARLMAPRGGTLRSLTVGEGALVAQGQTLGFVATSQALEGGGLVDEQVLASMRLEEESLRARLSAYDAAAPLELAELRANRAAIVAEREAALQAVATLDERRILAAERVVAAETLNARGLVADEELRRRQEALLALEQSIVDAQARVASLAARLTELDARLGRQSFSSQDGHAALEAQIAALAQRRAQAEAARGYELRAPIAGRVTGVQASLGQSLDPQRPLLTIASEGQPLVAELYVPSRAIGFIAPGQPVRLLYDAFPYQRF